MNAADPITLEHITPASLTTEAMHHTTGDTFAKVTHGPLACPVLRLWRDLDALVQDGSLLGVELNATHQDCPCFLLSVSPDKPQFYVELYRADLDTPFKEDEEVNDEEVPLYVLMNWLGRDTEPVHWETEWDEELETQAAEPGTISSDLAVGEEPHFAKEPDFEYLINTILLVIEAE